MTLVQELSAEWSPTYHSLTHLWEHRDDFAAGCAKRSFCDTSADRAIFPLIAFVKARHQDNLSRRQQALRILPMCCEILLSVASSLTDGHPLLRPIKELVVFPGVLDACKRQYLFKIANSSFPNLQLTHLR